jgi:transcriptional regulator GlxA family with amidase domain
VIFVLLPEVEVLDLAGPLQAFSEAKRYRTRLCATRERIHSHQGVVFADLEPLPEVSADSLVIVPGMPYAATERLERKVTKWLSGAAASGAHIASV